MAPQLWMGRLEAAQRVSDTPGHRGARPLGGVTTSTRPTSQAIGGGKLREQGLPLLAGTGRAFDIASGVGLLWGAAFQGSWGQECLG